MSSPFSRGTVLITGANGFIGSRLCRTFLAGGFHVVAGVRRTADLALLRDVDVEYRYGDLASPEALVPMVAAVDYVIHNAGLVKARTDRQFFDANETGTRHLIDAVVATNPTVKKVLYVSSLAAAGPSTNGRPVTESDPPHPITVYGQSKLAGEQVCRKQKEKLNVTMIRPPAVYGPGDREMLTIFKTVNNRIRPCFGDTRRRLQLVHVDDLCRGILAATTAKTVSGAVYFIAENRSYAMSELVNLLEEACQRRGLPLYVPAWLFRVIASISEQSLRLVGITPMLTREKAGELLASWEVATERAQTELGFESQISFAIGAKQTFDWYRTHRWL